MGWECWGGGVGSRVLGVEVLAFGCLVWMSRWCVLGVATGGGTVLVLAVCDSVVRFAVQGRRKVGGNGHRESSSARFRFRESIFRGRVVYTLTTYCCLEAFTRI